MTKFPKFKLMLAVFLASSLIFINNSYAAEKLHDVRWYKIYGSGFYFGDLIIDVSQDGDVYNIRTIGKAQGIAKAISGYFCDSSTKAECTRSRCHPENFKTEFFLRKKKRDINISYARDGEVTSDSNIPPENPLKRPPVPKNLKDGAYDPITVAIAVREKLREMRENGKLDKNKPTKFSLPVYDGRRRSRLDFNIYGREKTTVNGRQVWTIHLDFIDVPISGFTNNEIRDMPEQNPRVNVYVSDDDLLLPVKGDGQTRLGFASGDMVKECDNIKDCGGEK